MKPSNVVIHPALRALKPYQPGMSIASVQQQFGISDVIKLASNENPLGCSPCVAKAIQDALPNLHYYPDSTGATLKQALAAQLQVSTSQLTLGNGSDSLIRMICQVFGLPDHENIMSMYAFISYAIYTKGCLSQCVMVPEPEFCVDLAGMLRAITAKTRIIFIANPNNPTGTYISESALIHFLEKVPSHIIVVIDEAYFHYMTQEDYPNSIVLQQEFPNVMTIRTFSKAYGLAGLRIGYCIGHPELTDYLNRIRPPFNVTSVSQAAACAALADTEFLARSVIWQQQSLQQMRQGLQQLTLPHLPSEVAFMTVDFGHKAADIFEGLLQHGIIVRPLMGYQLPNYLRISLGTQEQNQRLLTTLATLLSR